MTMPFLFCALVTVISAIVSLGFSIAAGVGATGELRTTALYICASSLALAAVGAVPFLTGSIQWLAEIACSMIIVQTCDAIIGMRINDRMETYGPAGTALLNLAAAIWLLA